MIRLQLFGEEVGVKLEYGGVDDGQVVDVFLEGLVVEPFPALQASNFEKDEVCGLVEGESIGIQFQHLYVGEYHCLHLDVRDIENYDIWVQNNMSPGFLACQIILFVLAGLNSWKL